MNRWVSSVGVFDVDVQAKGIRSVMLADESADTPPLPGDVAEQLDLFINGEAASVSFDLGGVKSAIAQLTLAKLLEIPRGEVRSYAWVAREIGQPKAVRPVASAIARNPIPVLIPCHRVVRSDGFVGNFSLGGPEYKHRYLEFEGMSVAHVEELARRGVRLVADKESNAFHVVTCKSAPISDDPLRVELKSIAAALDAKYEPCERCHP